MRQLAKEVEGNLIVNMPPVTLDRIFADRFE